jgi:hypothetical protein
MTADAGFAAPQSGDLTLCGPVIFRQDPLGKITCGSGVGGPIFGRRYRLFWKGRTQNFVQQF